MPSCFDYVRYSLDVAVLMYLRRPRPLTEEHHEVITRAWLSFLCTLRCLVRLRMRLVRIATRTGLPESPSPLLNSLDEFGSARAFGWMLSLLAAIPPSFAAPLVGRRLLRVCPARACTASYARPSG